MRTKLFLFLILACSISVCFTACSSDHADVAVEGISLSKTSLTLKPDETETLTVEFLPSNATNQRVTWSSSDKTVATVGSSGIVTAIKPGNATITVVSTDGEEEATCEVTVSLNETVYVKGEVSGLWEKYSIVNIDGQIYIPKGDTLIIEKGVTVNIGTESLDNAGTKIELLVEGYLFCQGTEEDPVLFTVPSGQRTQGNAFARLWGGIVATPDSEEVLLDYAVIEYTGAMPTQASPSAIHKLFKTSGGGVAAFSTSNPNGKYVVTNSVFRNCGADAIYAQGGNCIFARNTFYAIGETDAEAIRIEAGCKVDAAYNLVYSANANALHLSNSGKSIERGQAQVCGYNNTIVNTGWRRGTDNSKGGSIWVESDCLVYIYNNLLTNCMFGIKAPGYQGTGGPDEDSDIDYNYYASGPQSNGTATAFDGFKPGVQDVVYAPNDAAGASVGDNDPLFVDFPFDTNPLLSYAYDESWDFHLEEGSPALKGAKRYFTPYFATKGIKINDVMYNSPMPSEYYGAFGQE